LAAAAHRQRAAANPSHDLTQVIDSWPELPEAIRAGILAMVRAFLDAPGTRNESGPLTKTDLSVAKRRQSAGLGLSIRW
jgi:hypothetical protein